MKRKLGRKTDARHQMLKNLAISLIIYENITTTDAKSKEVKSLIDKSINIAKKHDLNSQKKLLSIFLHNKNVVKKLNEDIIRRFDKSKSGYIKMYKINPRVGDNAPQTKLIIAKSKFLNNLDKKTNIKKVLTSSEKSLNSMPGNIAKVKK